jgi:hypothetical protein
VKTTKTRYTLMDRHTRMHARPHTHTHTLIHTHTHTHKCHARIHATHNACTSTHTHTHSHTHSHTQGKVALEDRLRKLHVERDRRTSTFLGRVKKRSKCIV